MGDKFSKKAPKAKKLQSLFEFMLAAHILFFILEIVFYDFVFSLVTCEVLYAWVCY